MTFLPQDAADLESAQNHEAPSESSSLKTSQNGKSQINKSMMMAKLKSTLAQQVDTELQEIKRKKDLTTKLEGDIKKKID